jgi:hypothetical protein
MTNLQALQVYQRYVEAWKSISDAQRKIILSEVFDENVEYLVPQFVGGASAKTWSASRSSILAPTSTSKTSPRITRSRCSSGCSFCRMER